MSRRSIAAFLLLLLVAQPAIAGRFRGEVTLSKSARSRKDSGVGDVVVYVEKVPDALERKLAKGGWWFSRKPKVSRITQRNLTFVPRVLAVTRGSQVEFQNLDPVYHNAFSVSASKRFDLGRYPPGHADTVAFERVGVMNLHCDVHPLEVGFVVVVPNHAFTRPDASGRFVLPKLPPGQYTIRAWHPRGRALRRQVEMPRKGDVDLELKL